MRYTQPLQPSRLWDVEIGVGSEQLQWLSYAAQCVAPDGDQPTSNFGTSGVDKIGREQHILLDRPAHGQDPADLVDCRTDDREIQAVLAADIAVENIADVKCEIDLGGRQSGGGALAVQLDDALAHSCRGSECAQASVFAIIGREDGKRAVADQLEDIAAMAMHGRDDDLGVVVE